MRKYGPITDEVVLVEDGSIGAEEGPLGPRTVTVLGADVEDLALSLRISVVTWTGITSSV